MIPGKNKRVSGLIVAKTVLIDRLKYKVFRALCKLRYEIINPLEYYPIGNHRKP